MIFSANTLPLSQAVRRASLPNVQRTLLGRFQPLVFSLITKRLVDFEETEGSKDIQFRGSVQPLSAQKLLIKPEGQRAWIWKLLYAEPDLKLKMDDVGILDGVRYRVMERTDYSEYGYVEYHLVNDYTHSRTI